MNITISRTVDQFQCGSRSLRIFRHTDTYGDVQDLPAHQIKRLPGALNDLLMNMFHTFVPTRIINGHAVDITGQVADDHIIPVKFLQKRAKLLYQFVPRHDSQSVIYLAEIININNKNADQPVILFGPTKKFGQKTHKIITVVQSGQTVVIRHVEKLFVLCFLFGDILYHNNLIRRPAIFVENPAGKLQPGLLSPLHTFHRVRLRPLFSKNSISRSASTYGSSTIS